MCGQLISFFERLALVNSLRLLVIASVVLVFGMTALSSRAQQGNTSSADASDLAQKNMSRVAASPAEIKAVLLRDRGLLVELKRWVAQDATGHGQIVSDSELTDDGIFDRLETDIPFRSVATSLLQRYGYLQPRMNPDSDAAKQNELLIQERSKWLAQDREEELAQARRREEHEKEPEKQARPAGSPAAAAPSRPDLANLPSEGEKPLTRAQTIQNEDYFTGIPSQLPLPNSSSVSPSLSNMSFNTLGTIAPVIESPRADQLREYESEIAFGPLIGTLPGPSAATNHPPLSAAPSPPEMVRTANPYKDVPSLYDMYVQAVSHPAALERFGAAVFENGTRDSQLIPMDFPVGPDYVVGPGDSLAVDLWGGVSQRLYRTVDREGRVSLPEIGPVLVSGKSLAVVQQSLQQILRTQFRDVSADVSLARLRTIRVYEVGDVANPGAYDISSLSTPLNALFAAGGPTLRGSMRILNHYRGNQLIQTVDVYDLLLHGVKTDIQRLENGDTVQVPPIGPQVAVEGMVHRPAIYELRNEKTLASMLELAGGLLPTAALRHIEVQRIAAHRKQTMLSLDIPEVDAAPEVTNRLETFEIQDGDRIRIYPIAPYNQDAVYLEGHVLRPGRYSYHPEMRVTDIIASYKDLLPEPAAQYAEIIRLNAPDFHPSAESFDLAAALANPSQAPVLHPMDTIRIFSRFDFEDPPAVSVLGDVRAPGTYQTSGQLHLTDAVHLAGGLRPDAETAEAQVFRYLPDGKFKIFTVRLSQALAGDPAENILLEPRDRLLIHQNPETIDPATVFIQGEVPKPGRYPLTSNMSVADLIHLGGGLKPSADTQTADLTRYQWSNQTKLTGQHETLALPAALAGDSNSNVVLRNGDVLTIRQLPGWNDLGASIAVRGEVKHPGTYGIRPGERLSSILERAGGFEPEAYAYGAILERAQVRELESKAQSEMIARVQEVQSDLQVPSGADPKEKQAKEAAMQQWRETLEQLTANPPTGRVTIRIFSNIARWRNTPADIEVRGGDILIIPKRPSYVMVTGQVFNPTAVAFRPGKSAKWYLSQSGGPTQLANKKAIFVIRANGSVVGRRSGLWSGDSLTGALQPGDTVVVPERAVGGGLQWQSVFLSAQVASSIASTVFIALRY